jgi:hypothetical protein
LSSDTGEGAGIYNFASFVKKLNVAGTLEYWDVEIVKHRSIGSKS